MNKRFAILVDDSKLGVLSIRVSPEVFMEILEKAKARESITDVTVEEEHEKYAYYQRFYADDELFGVITEYKY